MLIAHAAPGARVEHELLCANAADADTICTVTATLCFLSRLETATILGPVVLFTAAGPKFNFFGISLSRAATGVAIGVAVGVRDAVGVRVAGRVWGPVRVAG